MAHKVVHKVASKVAPKMECWRAVHLAGARCLNDAACLISEGSANKFYVSGLKDNVAGFDVQNCAI